MQLSSLRLQLPIPLPMMTEGDMLIKEGIEKSRRYPEESKPPAVALSRDKPRENVLSSCGPGSGREL